MAVGRPGLVRRLVERMTTPVEELEADELRSDADRLGATSIAELVDRQIATVSGAVRSTTLSPEGRVPALRAEIYDGSQPLQLVWLGRRRIAGIRPGVSLTAHGRVCRAEGYPTIYNPRYELLPGRGATPTAPAAPAEETRP
ncbi:OB-fold nucleic acid binding domain-containing protein [Arsenicicoccus dermatophilus]|uniref:OB-fold nucleic acid binding domain-containing protein n=1 Tax=Arsenicicoccus dermatophilus TaxID=1076331 RepID=UPI001F4CA89E|nr:OB-fold nucleic acid binding domain-containing protein [Arsenicicoccus dermatophilus]MCH8612613.1 OB-fold nucleic acid binding domain-containing protein [Arsenicicoccus dermatophilus]